MIPVNTMTRHMHGTVAAALLRRLVAFVLATHTGNALADQTHQHLPRSAFVCYKDKDNKAGSTAKPASIACVCYKDNDAGVCGLAEPSTIRMLHSQGRYWPLHSKHSTGDSMRIRQVWPHSYCFTSHSRLVPRLRARVTARARSVRHDQVFTEYPVTLTGRARLAEP